MHDDAQRKGRGQLAVSLAALAAAALISMPVSGLMVMASDSCTNALDDRLICDGSGQLLVAYLPLCTAVVGILVGGIGGDYAIRYRKPPSPLILVAWLLFLTGLVISCGIATQDKPPID